MSYLTFKIISIVVIFLILLTAIITRDTDGGRDSRRLIAGGKRRNRKREEPENTHTEKYQSDFKKVDFFDDSKSSDPEKQRMGSHFWIESRRASDGVQLSLYKNNWGAEADYMMREDGFVETIITVKGIDMQRIMVLCDNAENGREVVEYLHKRFSPDGYRAYINILQWFRDNNIGVSCWSN
jgi:hypothetical protein